MYGNNIKVPEEIIFQQRLTVCGSLMVGKMNQVLHRCPLPLPAKRKKVTTIEIIFYVYLVLNFMTLNENSAMARKVEFYDFSVCWEGVRFKIRLPI